MVTSKFSIYGREFVLFSNLSVTQKIINELIRFARKSRMKYRRLCMRFYWTRKPVCWQLVEMMMFTIHNNRKYGGLTVGLVEANELSSYRRKVTEAVKRQAVITEKVKEAYDEDSVVTGPDISEGKEDREEAAQCFAVGDENRDKLLS